MGNKVYYYITNCNKAGGKELYDANVNDHHEVNSLENANQIFLYLTAKFNIPGCHYFLGLSEKIIIRWIARSTYRTATPFIISYMQLLKNLW